MWWNTWSQPLSEYSGLPLPAGGRERARVFLTYHDILFERTHDLTELLELAVPGQATFNTLREVAQELTPYAVLFRYPGDTLEPEKIEAERALQYAQGKEALDLEQLTKDMVFTPAGEFLMGSKEGEGAFDERPQHTVCFYTQLFTTDDD